MASKKTSKREQADAAWHRTQQMELPPEAPQERRLERYEEAPTVCPGCTKGMSPRSGWTPVFGDILQCGGCGNSIQVPRAEWERVGAAIHEYHARLAALPEKRDTGPRVRGAG